MRQQPVALLALSARGRRWLIFAAQAVASLAVIVLLVREARLDAVLHALRRVSVGWLLAALVVKILALSLHELRTWWLLRLHHPVGLPRIMGIGFLSGLLNFLLPLRAGDLAAVLLLVRECRVPGALATAAVGLVALLEAAALGVLLLVILGSGLLWWERSLGELQAHAAFNLVALGTVVGVLLLLVLGVLGRWLGARRARQGAGRGLPRAGLGQALEHAGQELGRGRQLAGNLGLALVDVAMFLATYALLLPALDLHPASPLFVAGTVMAVASLSSLVLPPTMGAGTAAAAVFGLGLFGVGEADALAYAALLWLVGNLPTVLLGLPPMTRRVAVLGDLLVSRPAPDPPTG